MEFPSDLLGRIWKFIVEEHIPAGQLMRLRIIQARSTVMPGSMNLSSPKVSETPFSIPGVAFQDGLPHLQILREVTLHYADDIIKCLDTLWVPHGPVVPQEMTLYHVAKDVSDLVQAAAQHGSQSFYKLLITLAWSDRPCIVRVTGDNPLIFNRLKETGIRTGVIQGVIEPHALRSGSTFIAERWEQVSMHFLMEKRLEFCTRENSCALTGGCLRTLSLLRNPTRPPKDIDVACGAGRLAAVKGLLKAAYATHPTDVKEVTCADTWAIFDIRGDTVDVFEVPQGIPNGIVSFGAWTMQACIMVEGGHAVLWCTPRYLLAAAMGGISFDITRGFGATQVEDCIRKEQQAGFEVRLAKRHA